MLHLQPVLEVDLILLRPLHESDFDSLYDVAKDPLIWEQHPNNDRYKKDVFTAFFKDAMESKGALVVIDKSDNKIIGSSRFKIPDNADHVVEIGWTFLARNYWGGKYNRLIKKLMIDYAFQAFEMVVFHIGKGNIRSQKAIEKIGGIRIIDPESEHLRRDKEKNWTYKIHKTDWNKLDE